MNSLVEVKVDTAELIEKINSKLDEKEAQVREYVDSYKNYVVSEDTLADGTKLLADIRKELRNTNDARIQFKKDWNAPCDGIEKRMKEIAALYDEPIARIDKQVKQIKEDQKAKKRKDIAAAFEDLKGDAGEYLSLERIYSPKWENATVSMKSIQEDIRMEVEKVHMDILTIQSYESKYEDKGLAEYKRTNDLHAAILLMNDYKKKEEEILARQEAERKAEEERKEAERKAKEAGQREKEEREWLEAEPKCMSVLDEQRIASDKEKIQEAAREFEQIALGGTEEAEDPFQPDGQTLDDLFTPPEIEPQVIFKVTTDLFGAEDLKKFLESGNFYYEVIEQ